MSNTPPNPPRNVLRKLLTAHRIKDQILSTIAGHTVHVTITPMHAPAGQRVIKLKPLKTPKWGFKSLLQLTSTPFSRDNKP